MTIDQRLKELKKKCLSGEHTWREYRFNTVVDEFGNPTGEITFVGFLGAEPKKRKCIVCGRTEINRGGTWEKYQEFGRG